MKPRFFADQAAFGRWLEKHHASVRELWVGFHKKGSGKPSITWPQSVDEALRFGWIDGVRKSLDEDSYVIRFTPRQPRSIWSDKNIRRVQELIELGRMAPAGLEAFERREEDLSRRYSFEQDAVVLPAAYETELRANAKAWTFFQSQPPYYRKMTTWWIISAKREDTRLKRLAILVRDSAAGERLAAFRRP